jgi:hypothetical protein
MTRAGTRVAPRGTKCPVLTVFSRGVRRDVLVTTLNTIILLPPDGIKQEYAQADRPANSGNSFQGTRLDKGLKSA